jgi:uncharacterized protein with NRDE domain
VHLKENAQSRGVLLRRFLTGDDAPEAYVQKIKRTENEFYGFNLLAGDGDALWYYSNKTAEIQKIAPGIHGLSNHLLDTPWPKVKRGKAAFENILKGGQPININDIFHIFMDQTSPPDEQLPDTGIGRQWEQMLAPIFVKSPIYGTRSTSLVLINKDKTVTFIERTYKVPVSSTLDYQTCETCYTITESMSSLDSILPHPARAKLLKNT